MSLRIYLLGQFKLLVDDLPVELPSRPAQSLLAYLAMFAGVTHRREKLAALMWPDATETNARSYLRRIEQLTETPIDIISTGPERAETILLRHPFQ